MRRHEREELLQEERRSPTERTGYPRNWTEARVRRMADLVDSGTSMAEVARCYGVSDQTLRRALRIFKEKAE